VATQPVQCPHCGGKIELTEALAGPLIEAARQQFERGAREREKEIAGREAALASKGREMDQARAAMEQEVGARVKAQARAIEAQALKQAEAQVSDQLQRARQEAAAKDQILADRERKLSEAANLELELRRERQKLREEREQVELTMQRAMDQERARVRESSMREAAEQYRLAGAEKDKLIADMQAQVEELRRKADQGSSQLRGEVHELDLEATLRSRFPRDVIEPVPKGQFGGDVLQRVVSDAGMECGTLIWECKRTRNWSDGWLAKLRDDQRAAKAELAVLLTSVLPREVETFAMIEDVWVTGQKSAVPLATALRQLLMEVAGARQAGTGQQTKMEMIYQYLVGPRYRQRVAAIVEAFSVMQEDLDRERRAMTKQWAKREEQIGRVMTATVGMYGDLQGIAGRSLPEIEGLDFPALGGPEGDAPLLKK